MSGKKKIVYPIDLEFNIGAPLFFNNAKDKYIIHKELIDKLLGALKGSFRVGYVKRDRNFVHGINAHSLNEAIREKLKDIDEIQGETDVVFGSFLPPIHTKGEFDFSIYDKESNFYNFWNYCFGKAGVRDGETIVDYYIRDEKTKEEWAVFLETQMPKKSEDLVVPSDVFNVLGEIQFGNWAMVYKDMFRLVSAINKKAKIDLYMYVAASGKLKKLMSDGVVGFEDACKRFEENVENHNINKPVMIIPLDVAFDIDTYDFSVAEQGYESICEEIAFIEKKIEKKKKDIKRLLAEKKIQKGEELKKTGQKLKRAKAAKIMLESNLSDLKNKYKEQEEFEDE